MKRSYGIILTMIAVLMTGCGGAGAEGTIATEGMLVETQVTEPSKPDFDEESYKAGCVPIDYREFFRYEDRYKGTDVYQILEVSQVMEDGGLRGYSITDGLLGDEYYVQDSRYEKDMRILVDDKIIVWGTYTGTVKLTRAINDLQEDVFAIDAKIIELLDETADIGQQVRSESGQAEPAASMGDSLSGSDQDRVPALTRDIFRQDPTTEVSWHSGSTGYYLIPFGSGEDRQIWFTTENNTIWANTAYTVDVSEIEEIPAGGIVCKGEMYQAAKEDPGYIGKVEVTWASTDLCSVAIDGGQTTDVSMVADDYFYYGETSDSIGGKGDLGDMGADGGDDLWYLEFIFPYSDVDAITDGELAAATDEQLRIGKNEIYANHGRMFNSQDLQDYFNGCSWYFPSIRPEDFDESVLSAIEKENIKRIQAEIDRRSGR